MLANYLPSLLLLFKHMFAMPFFLNFQGCFLLLHSFPKKALQRLFGKSPVFCAFRKLSSSSRGKVNLAFRRRKDLGSSFESLISSSSFFVNSHLLYVHIILKQRKRKNTTHDSPQKKLQSTRMKKKIICVGGW